MEKTDDIGDVDWKGKKRTREEWKMIKMGRKRDGGDWGRERDWVSRARVGRDISSFAENRCTFYASGARQEIP